MNIKHLVQGYNFNRIPVKVEKEIEKNEERAGVLKFDTDISASYLLDEENIVVAMNLFVNCVVTNKKTLDRQIEHTTKTIEIIQKTIELLGNTSKEEANTIMKKLGMFKGKIVEKSLRYREYLYRIESTGGLLIFSILEEICQNDKE